MIDAVTIRFDGTAEDLGRAQVITGRLSLAGGVALGPGEGRARIFRVGLRILEACVRCSRSEPCEEHGTARATTAPKVEPSPLQLEPPTPKKPRAARKKRDLSTAGILAAEGANVMAALEASAGLRPPKSAKKKASPVGDLRRSYADAFARGMKAATGADFTPPKVTGPDDALIRLCRTHAKTADGKLIGGTELLQWIERTTERFRRSAPIEVKFHGEWTPRGMAWFLDDEAAKRGANGAAALPGAVKEVGGG